MQNAAIGVFDSGLGGLTAVRRLHERLPREDIIYLGDTGRVPYGTRGRDTIIKYTRQDVRFLMRYPLKAIVVACNTASAAALPVLQEECPIPLFGTVLPSCRAAVQATRNNKIGVLGTVATIASGVFTEELQRCNPSVQVHAKACPLFVPLVENGRTHRGDVVIETVVREYLQELKQVGVDTLILGCTHYPLLEEVLAEYMGDGVALIDSGAEAAGAVEQAIVPTVHGTGQTHYFVSDDPAGFARLAKQFLGEEAEVTASLVDLTAEDEG